MPTMGACAVRTSARNVPTGPARPVGVERPQVDLDACDPVALLFLSRGFLNAFW